MMPMLALKILEIAVGERERLRRQIRQRSCHQRHLAVTATPDDSSTVPKNITSISGRWNANSTAARPRQSFLSAVTQRRKRRGQGFHDFIHEHVTPVDSGRLVLNVAVAVRSRLPLARLAS